MRREYAPDERDGRSATERRRSTAGRVPVRSLAVPPASAGAAAPACRAGECPDPRLPATYGTARSARGVDGRRAGTALGDGLRRGRRALPRQRPLRAAPADGALRLPRLVAPADRRTGGLDLRARRRGHPPPRGCGEQRGVGARRDARPPRRGLLPARLGRPAGMARGLLLEARARGLHPRGRDRPDLRPARKDPRTRHRRARADRAGRRGDPGARRGERDDSPRRRRRARGAPHSPLRHASGPRSADRRRRLDPRVVGRRPRRSRRRRRRPRSRPDYRTPRFPPRLSATSSL